MNGIDSFIKVIEITQKMDFNNLITQEIWFIQEISHKISIKYEIPIPQELIQYIKQYSALSANKYFEQNFKEFYSAHKSIFRHSWKDFNIPLQLYPRLSQKQENNLYQIFLQKPYADATDSYICQRYNLPKPMYYLLNFENYQTFIDTDEPLRKCLCYLPQSFSNDSKKRIINPEQGILVKDINLSIGSVLSKNKKFNGYFIMPIIPTESHIKIIKNPEQYLPKTYSYY